ncbi:MAG: glycosyl transferase family 2, partial [Nanoarchaeota archaeon]
MLDKIWTFSEFNRSYWIKDGLPANIIDIMPFGIDTDIFSPDGEKAIIQNKRKFTFLTNGDFTERKNFEGLIEAFVTEFNGDE